MGMPFMHVAGEIPGACPRMGIVLHPKILETWHPGGQYKIRPNQGNQKTLPGTYGAIRELSLRHPEQKH